MQCPGCAQQLADQMPCPNCRWEDKTLEVSTDTNEHEARQGSPDSSPAPPPNEELPQAADSCEKPAESEPPKCNEPQPAGPSPASEVDPGNTLNDKGDIRIIGQAKKNIGRLDETDVRENEISAGRDVNIGHFTLTEPAKPEDQKSLYPLTKKRPQRPPELPQSVMTEVNDLVLQLRNTRLMFISCASRQLAIEAGYAANAGLVIANPDQDRVLRYADAATANLEFTVQRLLDQLPELGETAIVVDAYETSAETFSDSILNDKSWIDIIRNDLESNNLFLVVTVSAKYAQKNLKHAKRQSSFAYLVIPFLRPFLEQNYQFDYEKLEADIMQQRAHGVWEADEINFCQQVTSFHYGDQLQLIVDSGGPRDSQSSAESLLKGISEVEKTVLYTAAFFQEITSPEFCRVVEALLSKRTMRVASQTSGGNGNGETTVTAQVEVPLNQTWEAEKDDVFTKLLLETSAGNDVVRVVSLSESGLREPLRRLFEKQHRFYMIDQFKALQESGILFYPSLRLAENTTQIAVEMARLYPDEFNEGWIVALVIRLRQHFASDRSAASEGKDPMFQFLQSSQPGALNLAFARVSDICRRLLESSHQKSTVQNSLQYLMKSGYHEEVLWLIKQLKFSQEFDELYWLKQLLHRADTRTRHLTYYYLYSYLKRMGSGVYEGLTKIEAWLPPTDRETYSQFDTFVFRLLIQYCLETIDRFEAKHYGKWPSRYPLFVIKDQDKAIARTSLLARWLLHPGIDLTLASLRIGGTQITLIGALLAEWSFILLGPDATLQVDYSLPQMENQVRPELASKGIPPPEYSASFLFNLLFQQFASRTDLTQRLELLKYWNRLDHDLLKFLGSLSSTSELRKELTWKRKLVRQLVTEIKKAATTSKTRAIETMGTVNVPSRQDQL